MSFTCPDCGLTSHSPEDEKDQYCGNCHTFPEDREFSGLLGQFKQALKNAQQAQREIDQILKNVESELRAS